jgi:hypothetical protein
VTLFTGLKEVSMEKEIRFGMPLLAKSSTNVTAECQKKMFSVAAEPGAPWHRPEISSISFQQRSSARFKRVSNPITKIAAVSWKDADLILGDLSPKGRSQRFPSVQERVRFYMASWYTPSCSENEDDWVHYRRVFHRASAAVETGLNATSVLEIEGPKSKPTAKESIQFLANKKYPHTIRMVVDDVIRGGTIFSPSEANLYACAQSHPKPSLRNMYCPELLETLVPLHRRYQGRNETSVPLLVQVGDVLPSKQPYDGGDDKFVSIPHFKKFRLVANQSWGHLLSGTLPPCQSGPRSMHAHGLPPILFKLAADRHYRGLETLAQYDRPWSEKRNAAVFRGALTGPQLPAGLSELQKCQRMPRCRMVLAYVNSTLVNAKLTAFPHHRLPSLTVDSATTIGGSEFGYAKMLSYKAIIMVEGNDVASGLKWALLSNSVVLMSRPTVTSWAMEELLEPYVHFVPLASDLDDCGNADAVSAGSRRGIPYDST